MKPVNLLPEKDRPYVPSGRHQGSAYVIVGTLGVLLVALVAYVWTANQVTGRQAEAEKARQETAVAESRAAKLGGFTSFAQVRKARESSVKDKAEARFDWERLSLELARVLPRGVFAIEIDAAVDPENSEDPGASGASTGASGSSSSAGGAEASGEDGPQLKLIGCAPTQPDVATTMVRLRSLNRAREVTLVDSSREDSVSGGTTGPAAGPSAAATEASDPGGSDGCSTVRGPQSYKFEVDVAFTPEGKKDDGRTPSALGGGS